MTTGGSREPTPLWATSTRAPRLHIDDLNTSPTMSSDLADFTGRPASAYAPHATPAAAVPRMFTDHLPRRSLLADAPPPSSSSSLSMDADADAEAAAAAVGRRTLDPFAGQQSPSMRHLHQFRPVASPQAAMRPSDHAQRLAAPPGMAAPDARSLGLSTATSSRDRDNGSGSDSHDRVRLQDAWHTDMWLYMKNAHPVVGVFAAPARHPYKRRDRALVLLVALLALFLLCGAFATQECCTSSLDVPIAVLSRRLDAASAPRATDERQCAPFYGECGGATSVCAEGSTCSQMTESTAQRTCEPLAAANASCASDAAACASGWTCDARTLTCAPSTALVCYLPPLPPPSSSPLRLAASDSDSSKSDGMTAIEAIFGILIIANGNGTTNSSTSGSGADGSASQPPSASPNASALQALSMVLAAPVDGGVYSVQATLAIRWEIRATSGGAQPLESFSVAFSADDKPFTTIATDVRASIGDDDDGEDGASVFRFDWDLRGNTSLLCAKCVLRVCAFADGGRQVCIRSDGGNGTSSSSTTSSSNRVSTAAAAASDKRGIAFRIVREVVACSCGVAHAAFVEAAYLLALAMPLAALLLQQLVTFYEDAKLSGLCVNTRARQLSPSRLQLCAYSTRAATRVGRAVVVLVLAAACVGCGYFAAQVTDAKFFGQTGAVALLWLGTFGLSLLVGFVYCSALWLAIFSLRWKREGTNKQQQRQHRRHQQQSDDDDDSPPDSERVVEMSDFVLTRHQEQRGGGIV